MNVSEAVAAGDHRAVLEAQLAALAEAIDEAEVDSKPGLSREIRLVLKELEALPHGVESSRADALAARRKAKQAAIG